MSFTERLRILIDVDGKGGTAALKSFGTSIREANGFAGKFKAGASSAMQSVKANAAALAVAGGAALVAFGVKAVKAFEDTAKAALDMSKVTGKTIEESSRWIAVGKDYEVGAATITAAMIKVGKTGKDFISSLVEINEAAPADRMKVAFDLFGKSAAGLAPLLGKTRAEYEKMLGAVESGQVITAGEAAKAERMRLAQDQLSDAVNEVTLAFGGVVAGMAPQIEAFADSVSWITELTSKYDSYIDRARTIADLGNPLAWMARIQDAIEGEPIDILTMSLGSFEEAMHDIEPTGQAAIDWMERWLAGHKMSGYSLDDLSLKIFGVSAAVLKVTGEIATGTTEVLEFGDGNKEAAQAAYELKAAAEESAAGVAELKREFEQTKMAYDELTGAISDQQGWTDLQLNLLGIGEKLAAAKAEFDSGGMTAQQYALTIASITQGAQGDIADYLTSLDGIPPDVLTKLLTEYDPLNPQATMDAIQAYITAHGLIAEIRTVHIGQVGYEKRARGGPAGGLTLVGEEGPELVNLPGGSFVHTAGQTKGMLSGGGSSSGGGGATNVTVNVNVGPGADPVSVGRATADALAAYYRNGGTRP